MKTKERIDAILQRIKNFKIHETSKAWKLSAIGLASGIIVVAIVFALPIKTIAYEATETYYETDMKQEPYTVTEPYIVDEMYEESGILFDGYRYVWPSGAVVEFQINRPNARLTGSFENSIPGRFAILRATTRQTLYEKSGTRGNFDIPLSEGKYEAKFTEDIMWGEECYINLEIKWTETRKITKYREVTNYREIPVEIEKQRTVIKYKKISIWKDIFD